MVHELHKRGFQNLAIYTGMSASGLYWRCEVLPLEYLCIEEGLIAIVGNPGGEFIASYSSGQDNEYFGWKDVEAATARLLADKFEHRFSRLCQYCHGENFAYAGWLTWILGVAETGSLPVMYADYPSPSSTPVWGSHTNAILPVPRSDRTLINLSSS